MLETLQYVTSGFWVFMGCTTFTTLFLFVGGWAINAVLVGMSGKKCSGVIIK